MNITIILPAVQILKRDDSPQPTTPFPPVSITPSPSPYNPMTPFSPSEFQHFSQNHSQNHSARELTKSRADLAARQAAYEYDNEEFESPSPTPPPQAQRKSAQSATQKRSPASKSLIRQFSVNEFGSTASATKHEAFVNNSSIHTTTESLSSVDTVKTAIEIEPHTLVNEMAELTTAETTR